MFNLWSFRGICIISIGASVGEEIGRILFNLSNGYEPFYLWSLEWKFSVDNTNFFIANWIALFYCVYLIFNKDEFNLFKSSLSAMFQSISALFQSTDLDTKDSHHEFDTKYGKTTVKVIEEDVIDYSQISKDNRTRDYKIGSARAALKTEQRKFQESLSKEKADYINSIDTKNTSFDEYLDLKTQGSLEFQKFLNDRNLSIEEFKIIFNRDPKKWTDLLSNEHE